MKFWTGLFRTKALTVSNLKGFETLLKLIFLATDDLFETDDNVGDSTNAAGDLGCLL